MSKQATKKALLATTKAAESHPANKPATLPGITQIGHNRRQEAPAVYWQTVDTGVQMKKEAASFAVVAWDKLASNDIDRLSIALGWPQVEHKALKIAADTILVPSKRSKSKSRSKPAIENIIDAAPHWQDVANKIAVLSKKKNKTGDQSFGTGEVAELQMLRADRAKAIAITADVRRIANMVQAVYNLDKGFVISFQMDEDKNTKSLRPIRFKDKDGLTGKLSVTSFIKLHPSECKSGKLADLFETERDEPTGDGANNTSETSAHYTKLKEQVLPALSGIEGYFGDDERMKYAAEGSGVKTQLFAHARAVFMQLGNILVSNAGEKKQDAQQALAMLAELVPAPVVEEPKADATKQAKAA